MPIDTTTEEYKNKLAFISALKGMPWTKGILPMVAAGLLLSGGGAAAAEGIDTIRTKFRAKRYFNKMLKGNPDLRKKRESIKPYFRTLLHFSPEVAGDPLAAGSFVRRMHEFKDVGMPLQDVETLSKIRASQRGKGRTSILRDGTSGGVPGSMKDLGLTSKD